MNLISVVLPALLWGSPVLSQVLLLTDMYGTLQSSNFPQTYPQDSELQWNISVPVGYQIRLYFTHFDIEPSYLCEYDYVKVFSETEQLAVFCGKENTDTEHIPADDVITSPGNMLSVAFHSDFSNEELYAGFKAHYSAVDIDECKDTSDDTLACDHFCHNYIGGFYCSCRYGHQLHTDNRTCRVECSHSVYSEVNGTITSPNFPKPYPKSSDCVYRVEMETGFLITLDFDGVFDVEAHPDVTCPYDYIKIQVGERAFGPFCGDQSPGRIQTGSNAVSILFHSDNAGEHLGWKLTYSSSGSKCPVPELPSNTLLEPLQTEYNFKEHITVTCNPRYSILMDGEEVDHVQMECQADGSWSRSLPVCKLNLYLTDMKDTPLPEFQSQLRGPITSSVQSACGMETQPFPSQQKRIIGGRSASPGLFPWQVLLSVKDTSRIPLGHWYGSGALLSQSWVLTAAHVLRTQRKDLSVVPVAPTHVHATLGLTDIRDKWLAVNRSVERLILHPNFDPSNYNNDIALVKLSQDVELNVLVRPVCLPPLSEAHFLLPNTIGLVAGWGINMANASVSDSRITSELGVVSEILQYVKLPVVSQEECIASYTSRSVNYNITENMFCAGFYEGGRDTCLGDSGGAFVIKDPDTERWVVQGLVSWGGPEECGSQQVYGVYTKVANYVDWLQQTMDTECKH